MALVYSWKKREKRENFQLTPLSLSLCVSVCFSLYLRPFFPLNFSLSLSLLCGVVEAISPHTHTHSRRRRPRRLISRASFFRSFFAATPDAHSSFLPTPPTPPTAHIYTLAFPAPENMTQQQGNETLLLVSVFAAACSASRRALLLYTNDDGGGNNKKPRADPIDPLLVDAFSNILRLLLVLSMGKPWEKKTTTTTTTKKNNDREQSKENCWAYYDNGVNTLEVLKHSWN